jgi:CelD/BcsL family acetyltransferase involved in cellulose biosynthesis
VCVYPPQTDIAGFACAIAGLSLCDHLTSDNARWTKSLRDRLGLTTLVRLAGLLWCAAAGRARHTVRLAPLPGRLEGRTLFLIEERTRTISIVHKPCHSAAPLRSLPGLAPFVALLRTSHALRSTQGWAGAHRRALSPAHSR